LPGTVDLGGDGTNGIADRCHEFVDLLFVIINGGRSDIIAPACD
jgi:hypothetical protein